jgi:type IV fimbrial biogenesis protein FimT
MLLMEKAIRHTLMPLHLFSQRIRASNTGFTLIELMVVLAILAIVAALAAPNLERFIVRNRVASITNDYLATLNFARTEAITRNQCVSICPVANPRAADPRCLADDDWSAGWAVFVNSTCAAPAGQQTNTDPNELLRVREALPEGYALANASGTAMGLRFNPRGQVMIGGAGLGATINVMPPGGIKDTASRVICVNMMGQARTLDSFGTCL